MLICCLRLCDCLLECWLTLRMCAASAEPKKPPEPAGKAKAAKAASDGSQPQQKPQKAAKAGKQQQQQQQQQRQPPPQLSNGSGQASAKAAVPPAPQEQGTTPG